MLIVFGTVGLARPVLATTPDFTVSANPGKVSVSLGYWAETMLTLTSVNGFEGTVQLSTAVGPSAGLGAGFSTGMTLNPNGSVSTDLLLTPGKTAGNYYLSMTATIGSVSHILVIPITVSPVSSPDFTTRLWGSYSILQGRDITIPEQFFILGGFRGQVSLSAKLTPDIPNAPAVSFQPSTFDLSTSADVAYNTLVSTVRTTPIGNYIVAITASSVTISHTYQAIMMVGDYRPPSEHPPHDNSTSATNGQTSTSSATNNYWPLNNASSTLSTLQSLWWLQALIGLSITALIVQRKRQPFNER
jgi:hypothetical protein